MRLRTAEQKSYILNLMRRSGRYDMRTVTSMTRGLDHTAKDGTSVDEWLDGLEFDKAKQIIDSLLEQF